MILKRLYEAITTSESLYMTELRNTHFIGIKTKQRRNINVWSDYKILQLQGIWIYLRYDYWIKPFYYQDGENVRTGSKVKKTLFIPDTEWDTQKQIADYYEVSSQGIKNLYSQNKKRLTVMVLNTSKELL